MRLDELWLVWSASMTDKQTHAQWLGQMTARGRIAILLTVSFKVNK